MRVSDCSFKLPENFISRYPQSKLSACRLLSLDQPIGGITHQVFTDLLGKLMPEDLMLFNNTRVVPAKLFSRKVSDGKIEVLIERVLDDKRVLAHAYCQNAESWRRTTFRR